jgi:DNA-binding NarL/FixJ family response regulator
VLNLDVVLVDATRGDIDVAETARRVSKHEPFPRIVVLTDEETELHSAEAQRAGTIAFIRKPEALDDLVETLELVLTLMIDSSRAQCGG